MLDKHETVLRLDSVVMQIVDLNESLWVIGRKSDYVHQAKFERYQRELAKIANATAKLSRELGEEVRAEELKAYEQSIIDGEILARDVHDAIRRTKLLIVLMEGE